MIIGVTEGRPVTEQTLVVDVGGGSSEFCLVDPSRQPRAVGLRLGSARLTDAYVQHDPPTPTELAAMRRAAIDAVLVAPDATPGEIVAVGGTASNLIKVLPAAMLDRMLTRERIAEIQAILASEPATVAAERHLINPLRARILPAGGAIMDAILERYDAASIRVVERRHPRGGHPRCRARRRGLARSAGRPRPRLERVGDKRAAGGARSPELVR